MINYCDGISRSRNSLFRLTAILLLFVVAAVLLRSGESTAPSVQANDPVIFTFAVTGDSRQDPKVAGLSPQEKIWMEDTKPLSRIVREIQARKPRVLFFTGDMIMGYSTNYDVTERQYAYWRGLMSALPETGIYLVPIAGNHEMQVELPNPSGGKPLKVCERECETLWRENMGDLILDTNLWNRLVGQPVTAWDINNTPPIGGADGIQSDQRQLSFSFDVGKMHFAVINTSAYDDDARAPVHWLAADLARAKARGDQNFFVFGHEMAFTYRFNSDIKADGLDQYPDSDESFWEVIQDYDATYFCGHEHLYHAMQPGGSGSWQIICGAAGAPFDAKPGESKNPDDRDFGWLLVKVHASGRVQMDAYGFDEHFGPTKLFQSIELQK
ncbi:MAG TPA: metallophosphoesterase [Candidatus Aquilonibacter sp.]|nr:metallophosphoesterase [Candidatus Aquilonibacter sp.]